MSWVAVGTAAVGAVKGSMDAKAAKKAQESQNKAAAAQTENSPWTGMGAGQVDASPVESQLGGGLSGGLSGFMQGQNIKSAMAKNAAPVEAPVKTPGYDAAAAKPLDYNSSTWGQMGQPQDMMAGQSLNMGQDPNMLPTLQGMKKKSPLES